MHEFTEYDQLAIAELAQIKGWEGIDQIIDTSLECVEARNKVAEKVTALTHPKFQFGNTEHE